MSITSINPTTGELLKSFSPLSQSELDRKIEKAWSAFHLYRRTAIAERSTFMNRAADILESEKEAFARLITTEMGKTLRSAAGECAKCAWACRYFAETAERWL